MQEAVAELQGDFFFVVYFNGNPKPGACFPGLRDCAGIGAIIIQYRPRNGMTGGAVYSAILFLSQMTGAFTAKITFFSTCHFCQSIYTVFFFYVQFT